MVRADTSCADYSNRKLLDFAEKYGSISQGFSVRREAFTEWSEHCVECGVPYCYGNCSNYRRRFDSMCKRFDTGLMPIHIGDVDAVGFYTQKWGKFRGYFRPQEVKTSACIRLQKLYTFLGVMARSVDRLAALLRLPTIALKSFRKLWGTGGLDGLSRKRAGYPCTLFFWRCCADRAVPLHFQIYCGQRKTFERKLDLEKGWNEIVFSLPRIDEPSLILIYSTECDEYGIITESIGLSNEGDVEMSLMKGNNKTSPETPRHAKFVKCLAWDLDNTMWDGVLANDGIDGVKIREDAVALIKKLDERGIVNTILSKNDYDSAISALKKFELEEYFVFPAINWGQKSENLKRVAKTMNIGLDTFAFVDDSPFERGDVVENLPQVRVFDEKTVSELAARQEFSPPISAESKNRRMSYRKEMERHKAFSEFDGNQDDFLRSCNITLRLFDLKKAEDSEYTRCYELIQRTNQLTLTARRYEELELRDLVSDSTVEAYGIRCADKFGDYGIVGAIITRREADAVKVVEFVMSCRVAEKGCEYGILSHLSARWKREAYKRVLAELIRTGKNMALINAFDKLPFCRTTTEGVMKYSLDLQAASWESPIVTVMNG